MATAENPPNVDLERHLITSPRYKNGHIPTFQGLSHPPDWSEGMRLKLKGRIKSPGEIESRSRIWNIVRKIVARDRTIPYNEIADITLFTLQQVENTIHNKSPKSLHAIPPFTPQERSERRKRANANIPLLQRPPISQNETENRKFAGLLLKNSFITDDLMIWDKFNEVYEDNNMPLPESFARRLIFEAFITAVIQAQKGNRELMDKYLSLGKSINPNRFREVPIRGMSAKDGNEYISPEEGIEPEGNPNLEEFYWNRHGKG